jgi:dual specificity MAP kinase phosphatase
VPNKHIPVCPPGPVPVQEPNTPPPSPAHEDECRQASLLYPPDGYGRVEDGPLAVFKINAAEVAAALDYVARQPLPDPSKVFPWFHGLHPSNQVQQAFFIARRRTLRKTPTCLRGVTLVKADGDLTVSRLKGAIAPGEFLQPDPTGEFLEIDPKEGFSVRNFQIQAAKSAMTSDIIVYGDDSATVRKVGWQIASAQAAWHKKHEDQCHAIPSYNTFICTAPFQSFELQYPDIVSINSSGQLTGAVLDFFHQERTEMYAMTQASEISQNVWLGPTPEMASEEEQQYDVLIECSDLGKLNPSALRALAEGRELDGKIPYLDFPSSGSIMPPTWSHADADGILDTCKWIWHLSHGTLPSRHYMDYDGDTDMSEDSELAATEVACRPKKILIHCADGYTESTMLGIAYFSYSTGMPIPEAWLNLHTTKKRNFFAYPTDVALLTSIATRLLQESPVCANMALSKITEAIRNEPKWLASLDGSLPSRVLDYMYLGNLGHANNPDLLKAMGIGQILSVGETAMWRDGELEEWGHDNVKMVQAVQDNGIDPLTEEFIGMCPPLSNALHAVLAIRTNDISECGRRNGTATLVHCRVGVSRSATICIAEVMKELNLSFPRAYCFVRARRLNVIIQPHLRFAYELLKWEEILHARRPLDTKLDDTGFKRELEWAEIAREIALMNRPYAR